ncbi:MAG: hypothetical protein RMY35_028855 [Nostoc sp. DedSLP01]
MVIVKLTNIAIAKNKVTQNAKGGDGGNGGKVTIGGGKESPVLLVGSPIKANGGKGGDAINSSDNAVGAGS